MGEATGTAMLWRRRNHRKPLSVLRQDAAKPLWKLERLTGEGEIRQFLLVARSQSVREIDSVRREARRRYRRAWLRRKSDQFVSVGIIICTLYFIAIFFVWGLFSGRLTS